MLAIVVRFTTKKEEFKFFTTEHICFTWFGGTYSTSIINTLNGGFVGRSICCERPPLRSGYHVKECCKEHVACLRQLGSTRPDGNACIVGFYSLQ